MKAVVVAAMAAGLAASAPGADSAPAPQPQADGAQPGGVTPDVMAPDAEAPETDSGTTTPPATEAGARQRFVSPTTGDDRRPVVLRAFDKPAQRWLPGHRGVDVELAVGQPVLAAADGVVAFAGMVAGTPVVSVDHPSGIRSTYQPVYASVSKGDVVVAGQELGTLAPPTDGYPGLHWGARIGRDYVNPMDYLARPVIRLKPTPPHLLPQGDAG